MYHILIGYWILPLLQLMTYVGSSNYIEVFSLASFVFGMPQLDYLYVWGWGGVVKICATSLVELSSIITAYEHVFVQ